MSSKFLIYIVLLIGHISIWCGCNGDTYVTGSSPNVTGLSPSVSIFRTTYLYQSAINISLTVYQRPVNNTMKQTLRVINGNTNVDSTNRCIGYGVSFTFRGQYPIMNATATGNGGCDAILGSQCSESIRNILQQSFDDINKIGCGVSTKFLSNPPRGCLQSTANSLLVSSTFLNNGSYMLGGSSASNSSVPWIYTENDPSVDGNYDELTKYFVFVYFVGRPYSSGIIDSAIACLSIYNTASSNNIAMKLPLSENITILVSLLIILFNIIL